MNETGPLAMPPVDFTISAPGLRWEKEKPVPAPLCRISAALPRGTKEIPIISLGFSSISIQFGVQNTFPVRPTTSQRLNGAGYGYTAILYDSNAATLTGTGLPSNFAASAPAFLGDLTSANAAVAVGLEFTLSPTDLASDVNTRLTVIGNQTGASVTNPVTVKAKTTR